jgi:hypothetical protein
LEHYSNPVGSFLLRAVYTYTQHTGIEGILKSKEKQKSNSQVDYKSCSWPFDRFMNLLLDQFHIKFIFKILSFALFYNELAPIKKVYLK